MTPQEILIERLERDLRELRVLIGAPTSAPAMVDIPDDLISVDTASTLARVKTDTIRKWAREHPYDGCSGFGVMLGTRRHIVRSPFLSFIRRNRK